MHLKPSTDWLVDEFIFRKKKCFVILINEIFREVFSFCLLVQDVSLSQFPPSATTLHFEFYAETTTPKDATSATSHSTTIGGSGGSSTPVKNSSSSSKPAHHHHPHGHHSASVLQTIHVERVYDSMGKLPSELMEELTAAQNASGSAPIPKEKLDLLFTHLRLAFCFASTQSRIQCVQARLQALSILVYSNSLVDNANTILYNGLIEELVDILELKPTTSSSISASASSLSAALKRKKDDSQSLPPPSSGTDPAQTCGVATSGFYPQVLTEIKAAALRTLTSIIHLDRNPKMTLIIDATGASSYHGFLPVLVRSCIQVISSG